MKNRYKRLKTVMISLCMLGLFCLPASAAGISVKVLNLRVGDTYKLKVKGVKKKKLKKAKWKSSNKSVASVSKKGVVKAKKAGTTKITVKVKKKKYTCKVTVREAMTVTRAAQTTSSGSGGSGSSGSSGSGSGSGSSGSSGSGSGSGGSGSSGSGKGSGGSGSSGSGKSSGGSSGSGSGKGSGGSGGSGSSKGSGGSGSSKKTTKVTVKDKNTSGFSSAGLSGDELAAWKKILSFQKKYPEGKKFTNDDYYKWKGGIYRGGYGCAAFCFELSDACFGSNTTEFYAPISEFDLTELRPGDILRVDDNTHSVLVVNLYDEGVVIAEANYNKSVHWGRNLPFDEIKETGTNVMTRYSSTEYTEGALLSMQACLPDLKDPKN